MYPGARSIPGKLKDWFKMHERLINRWSGILLDLRHAETREFTILFVAIRELLDLAKASRQSQATESSRL